MFLKSAHEKLVIFFFNLVLGILRGECMEWEIAVILNSAADVGKKSTVVDQSVLGDRFLQKKNWN